MSSVDLLNFADTIVPFGEEEDDEDLLEDEDHEEEDDEMEDLDMDDDMSGDVSFFYENLHWLY